MKLNGSLFCDKCGEYIGTEETLGHYAYISRKYCGKCGKFASLENDRKRKQMFRKNRKEETMLLKHRVSLLESENKLLEEAVLRLKAQLAMMNG